MNNRFPINIFNFSVSAFLWLIIILLITQCACGIQSQTLTPAPAVNTEIPDVQIPAQVLAVEPTEKAAPVYVTTTSLRVRKCGSIKCDEIADPLPAGTELTIFVTDIVSEDETDGCIGGEWYSIEMGKIAGYVCSLYVEER